MQMITSIECIVLVHFPMEWYFAGSSKEYPDYLPSDVLAAGIKSGLYVEGTLRVNKYHAQDEAYVSRGR